MPEFTKHIFKKQFSLNMTTDYAHIFSIVCTCPTPIRDYCSRQLDQHVSVLLLSVDAQTVMAVYDLHVVNHGIDPSSLCLLAVDSAVILNVHHLDTCHKRQFIHFHTILTIYRKKFSIFLQQNK